MGAKELFDAGNLSAAIDQLTQAVKSNLRDLRSRIFLFELLCFGADYQRAERQLDAIAQTSEDVKGAIGAQVYRNALQAEKARHAFFTETNRLPRFFSELPSYAAFHIEAVNHLRESRFEELEEVLTKSAELHTSPKGEKDGTAFENFTDGDDLIGPFLGRMTDWKTVGQRTLLCAGQRTFFADETECPLLEIRTIGFAVST